MNYNGFKSLQFAATAWHTCVSRKFAVCFPIANIYKGAWNMSGRVCSG